MKRLLATGLLLTTSLMAQPIRQTAWVTEDGSTPIAVLPFKGEGVPIKSDAPWVTIAKDFDFSSRVELHKVNRADTASFSEKGIPLYVDGEYRIVGDSIYLEISLNDVSTGDMLIGKSYPITSKSLRQVAHRFSNLVMETIFLEKGPFETKILYTRRSKEGKDVYIMDYDGHNSKKISRGGVNIMPCFINDNKFLWVYYGRGKPDIFSGDLKSGVMKPVIYSRGIDASPDYSPVRGRVLFSSTRNGNSEIYSSDVNGKSVQRLTVSPGIDASPAWSPNGFYIAFISDRSGSPQLYVMDHSGSGEKRLTFNGSYHDAPVWSPDGKKIAYTAQRDGKFDIYTINIDGTEERVISAVVPGSNQYPVWSPDGSQIIFVNTQGSISNLYRVGVEGEGEAFAVTKTGDVEMPAWSFIEE